MRRRATANKPELELRVKLVIAVILTVLSSTAFSASDYALCQVRAQNAAVNALLLDWPYTGDHTWSAGLADTKLVANDNTGAKFEISVEGSRTNASITTKLYQKYSVSTLKDEKGNCVAEQPVLLQSIDDEYEEEGT
jgi:hypothetical protein